MLLSKLITNIKSNLGNRVTGNIGAKTTDVAILDAINQTLKRLPVVAFPEYSERILKLILDEGKYAYDYPTKDINDASIRLLDILSHQLYDSSDNRSLLTYETGLSFDNIHNYLRTNDSAGLPTCMMRYGKKLYFSPTPDQTCIVYLRARCTVPDFTNVNVNEELFVSDDWLLPLEAHSTFLLYTALQQAQLASLWYTTYDDSRRETEQLAERQLSLERSQHENRIDTVDNPWAQHDYRG